MFGASPQIRKSFFATLLRQTSDGFRLPGFPASRLPGFPASGFGFPEVSRKMKKSALPEVCRKS
jgi:hypothetical protein